MSIRIEEMPRYKAGQKVEALLSIAGRVLGTVSPIEGCGEPSYCILQTPDGIQAVPENEVVKLIST